MQAHGCAVNQPSDLVSSIPVRSWPTVTSTALAILLQKLTRIWNAAAIAGIQMIAAVAERARTQSGLI